MAYHLVTYDLVKRKDYPKLWDELKRLGGVKPQDSAWFVDINNTAAELRDHLAQFIDGDDRLMVVEFSKRPRWTKMYTPAIAWIQARFGE